MFKAINVAAIQAQQLGWNSFKMQSRAFTNGIAANDVPIELDGIINDGGKLANNQL